MATNDNKIRKRMVLFRFYEDGNPNNAPLRVGLSNRNVTWRHFCNDNSFKDYSPILQFGVQTVPGTKIYFNQSTTPIVIGGTGVYELDLTNSSAMLNSFRIDPNSMQIINDLPNGYLIIDLVYTGEGGSS